MAKEYPENGQTYTFNREYARSLFDEITQKELEESKQFNSTHLYSRKAFSKEVFREKIAEYCFVSPNTVKKWLQKTNSSDPGSIELVHKLEEVLGNYYGKPVVLLISNNKQENNMITTISESEKNCARELYIRLLNAIDSVVPSYKDFLKNGPQAMDAYNNSMAESRYETVMAVKATAFDLPESLRLSAIALIDDIYGPESDEPGSFFCTNDFKEFIASDEYQQYVKENCPDGVDRDVDQLNYCEAKREELFSRLDEIFSAYIRRT